MNKQLSNKEILQAVEIAKLTSLDTTIFFFDGSSSTVREKLIEFFSHKQVHEFLRQLGNDFMVEIKILCDQDDQFEIFIMENIFDVFSEIFGFEVVSKVFEFEIVSKAIQEPEKQNSCDQDECDTQCENNPECQVEQFEVDYCDGLTLPLIGNDDLKIELVKGENLVITGKQPDPIIGKIVEYVINFPFTPDPEEVNIELDLGVLSVSVLPQSEVISYELN